MVVSFWETSYHESVILSEEPRSPAGERGTESKNLYELELPGGGMGTRTDDIDPCARPFCVILAARCKGFFDFVSVSLEAKQALRSE